MRVYEYSKKTGIPNKDIIKILKEGGFDIQNHMSMLNQEGIDFLEKNIKANAASPESNKKIDQDKNKEKAEATQEVHSKKTQESDKNNIEKNMQSQTQTKKEFPFKKQAETIDIKEQSEEAKRVVISIKPMMVGELAERLKMPATELILNLLKKGKVYNKNQVLPEDIVEELAHQYEAETVKEEKKQSLTQEFVKVGKQLTLRPPVVVVIGHVDHGKTTLLDFIRKSRVAAKEKGGITQHLGAYQVSTSNGGIVFLDTPGHEAFSMMRGRGIKVADVAILVVAADDGIMPQTVEAIKLAQSKNIPIIVALNKIDKVDTIRIDQVKTQLSKQGLMPEDWGGQTIFVPISAKFGQGVDQLLELISLQSEIMELKADESIDACGYVLESKIEKGLGPVATFIAQHGKIKIGDFFVCGMTTGKVNVLVDSSGKRIQSAGPSIPVQISGFDELPQVGDYLQVVTADEYRRVKADKSERKVHAQLKAIPKESINVLLKTDNDSSKEALLNSIKQLPKKDEREVYVVHSGVGNISENDVILAANVGAVIYGFGVKADANVTSIAQKNKVSIKLFDIIYHLLDDVKELIKSKKEIQYKKVKTGEAIVRKVFNIKGIGVIAGFYVKEGKIVKDGNVIIFRGNKKIGEGSIKTLQREKKSMKEVNSGFEGALLVDNYEDWTIDDRIECFINVPIE